MRSDVLKVAAPQLTSKPTSFIRTPVYVLQISTSFGNMDPFGTGQTLPPLQLPQSTAPSAAITQMKKPPKWIRRPVGASFAVSLTSSPLLQRLFVYLV